MEYKTDLDIGRVVLFADLVCLSIICFLCKKIVLAKHLKSFTVFHQMYLFRSLHLDIIDYRF